MGLVEGYYNYLKFLNRTKEIMYLLSPAYLGDGSGMKWDGDILSVISSEDQYNKFLDRLSLLIKKEHPEVDGKAREYLEDVLGDYYAMRRKIKRKDYGSYLGHDFLGNGVTPPDGMEDIFTSISYIPIVKNKFSPAFLLYLNKPKSYDFIRYKIIKKRNGKIPYTLDGFFRDLFEENSSFVKQFNNSLVGSGNVKGFRIDVVDVNAKIPLNQWFYAPNIIYFQGESYNRVLTKFNQKGYDLKYER